MCHVSQVYSGKMWKNLLNPELNSDKVHVYKHKYKNI